MGASCRTRYRRPEVNAFVVTGQGFAYLTVCNRSQEEGIDTRESFWRIIFLEYGYACSLLNYHWTSAGVDATGIQIWDSHRSHPAQTLVRDLPDNVPVTWSVQNSLITNIVESHEKR